MKVNWIQKLRFELIHPTTRSSSSSYGTAVRFRIQRQAIDYRRQVPLLIALERISRVAVLLSPLLARVPSRSPSPPLGPASWWPSILINDLLFRDASR